MTAGGRFRATFLLAAGLAALGWAYWKFAIPTHRVEVRSELVMFGDLDGDHRWAAGDLMAFEAFLARPFSANDSTAWRLDLNRNGLLDDEDLTLLRALVAATGDPYAAEEAARAHGAVFPRPRELYRYVPAADYRPRPLWALDYPPATDSVLDWLRGFRPAANTSTYAADLDVALYAEAVRFDDGWRRRSAGLLPIEREYAERKLARARALFATGERYELLLLLMELVEDAETLTARDQPAFSLRLLAFRDHLRDVLASQPYAAFAAGEQGPSAVLDLISGYLKTDLGLDYDFGTLGPARNLTNLESYLQRGPAANSRTRMSRTTICPWYCCCARRCASPAPTRAATGTSSAASASTNRRRRRSIWQMLVAMATGTGKTFLTVAQIYRIFESKHSTSGQEGHIPTGWCVQGGQTWRGNSRFQG